MANNTDLINEQRLSDYHDELMKTHLVGGVVFDISAYKASGEPLTPAKFADLTAALGTNGANVPEPMRKGGMSVKFIQSSDNKYVQYRCMTQNFTTDTTQWAVDDAGVYVDNPEFIYVKTDKDDKILLGVQPDGNVLFGAGVPKQIIEYVQAKIDEYHGDDIVDFLDDFLGSDNTLKEYLDNTYGKYIDNPEFIQVTTDSEGKIIEATKKDGKKVFYGGIEGVSAKLSNVITVGKDSSFDFTDIQDAIDSILDDSQLNRYTIIVFPGEYGRISQTDGEINRVRYMSIIGMDKQSCKILDNTGNYDTPCFEARMDGSVENLSFIMKTDAEHYVPGGRQNYAYALHSDISGERTTIFRNCYFESNAGPAVGLGTHTNVSLIFEDCVFVRYPFIGDLDHGTVFAHTGPNQGTGQLYVFRNCVAVNNSSNTSSGFFLRYITGTTEGNYKYIVQHCGSFSLNQPAAFVDVTLDYQCFGNNIESLNV